MCFKKRQKEKKIRIHYYVDFLCFEGLLLFESSEVHERKSKTWTLKHFFLKFKHNAKRGHVECRWEISSKISTCFCRPRDKWTFCMQINGLRGLLIRLQMTIERIHIFKKKANTKFAKIDGNSFIQKIMNKSPKM